MKILVKDIAFTVFVVLALCSSCSVIEKSSRHGFENGYYKMKSSQRPASQVYLDISDTEVNVYPANEKGLGGSLIKIPLSNSDSLCGYHLQFLKKSLDIDITTIPFKLRPSVYNLPVQMNIDFNAAVYAGWRHDNYYIHGKISPLKKCNYQVVNRGYDFGLFTGLGSTTIGPFTTRNDVSNEYNGMILQFGAAGFIESNIASFGLAAGYDYLFSTDRNVWIYNKKPWIGFIIGIALN